LSGGLLILVAKFEIFQATLTKEVDANLNDCSSQKRYPPGRVFIILPGVR
jgi:hypothetical protein